MSTYQDVIQQVEREVRSADAFPDASTKLDEQINAIYRYGVGLAKELPLYKLPVDKSSALTTAAVNAGSLKEVTMPDDINETRADLGIALFELEDAGGDTEIIHPNEAIPFTSLRQSAGNSYQAGNNLVAYNLSSKKLYCFASVANVYVHYAKSITEADDQNYTTTDIALDPNSIDVLVEAVAAHFTSVNAKDLSASRVHSTLSQILKE